MRNSKYLIFLSILLIISLVATYWNHFDNEFAFDDAHTIQNNIYIQDIKNIPLFFKKAETISSLPSNQVYRPMLTTSVAIDYWISSHLSKDKSGYHTLYYHIPMFFWFVVQLVMMFFMFYRIMQKALPHDWNKYIALFATAWYGFHTANAETINYIISRSDSYSTLALVAGLWIYVDFPGKRKYFLYLIPVVVGILTKQTVAMFAPIIFFYILFFENNLSLKDLFMFKRRKEILKTIVQSIPSFVISIGLAYLTIKLVPATYTPGGPSTFVYIITQPFVMLHYFITFFIPYHLTADAGWPFVYSMLNNKFIVGILFIIIMGYVAFRTSLKTELMPISFGIIWFFIALVPTSIIPLAEPMNDHRMFFPFVGLVLSVSYALGLLVISLKAKIMQSNNYQNIIVLLAFLIVYSHAYGTTVRNGVWDNSEELWYDVTLKNPEHGRGLMNYGLSQMRKGEYDKALNYFQRALQYSPYYYILHSNLGAVYNAMGKVDSAEYHHKKAIEYGASYNDGYYYYALFLKQYNRIPEAISNLEIANKLGPSFIYSKYELMELYSKEMDWEKVRQIAEETLKLDPSSKSAQYYLAESAGKGSKIEIYEELARKNPSADNFISLSLVYYNEKMFEKCIGACENALKYDKKNATAYNNMGSAYNSLQQWDKAIEACNAALKINPDFTLAKGNLNQAIQMKKLTSTPVESLDPNGLLQLSLTFYQNGMYQKCIEMCERAIKIKPDFVEAYNNICSAYNALEQYEKAIPYCEKAIKLNPQYELAKNNLKLSQSKLKEKQ